MTAELASRRFSPQRRPTTAARVWSALSAEMNGHPGSDVKNLDPAAPRSLKLGN
jgi:hypothetical protein